MERIKALEFRVREVVLKPRVKPEQLLSVTMHVLAEEDRLERMIREGKREKSIEEKLKKVKEEAKSKEEKNEMYDRVNLEFFVPFIKELKKSGLCAGCHIMSVHYTRLIPKLLKEVGLIKEELPPKPPVIKVEQK